MVLREFLWILRTCVTMFSRMITTACCLVVGLELGFGLGSNLVPGLWLVSGYAHVFIKATTFPCDCYSPLPKHYNA